MVSKGVGEKQQAFLNGQKILSDKPEFHADSGGEERGVGGELRPHGPDELLPEGKGVVGAKQR